MNAYEVGQVIYVLTKENEHIVPMQVCEEIRRRTIGGEEVTYLVRSGPDKGAPFRIEELQGKGEIFSTLDQAKVHLQNRFTRWLDKQVEWTTTNEKAWYAPKEPTT